MAKADAKALLEAMRAQLERDQAEGRLAGLTVDALADAMSHPDADAVVGACLEIDARSVKQGEAAPDFTLPWLPGAGGPGEGLTLSSHFGERPVALVFGSYT